MNFTKKNFIIFFMFLFSIFVNLNTKAQKNPFGISFEPQSKAIYFVNEDTNTLIYEKNKNLKIPCSALCKIMTTILILECPEYKQNPKKFLNKKITASPQIFNRLYLKGASNANIKNGETISVLDALYATMIQSACETTMMLVEMLYKDNTEEFVNRMNDKAKELKMENTYFVDPDGLDTENQYTTAYDMYLLIKYCLKNEMFKKIATSPTYDMPPTNLKSNPTKLIHTNKMLSKFQGGKYYDSRVLGIKTAKIDDGDNLITIAKDKSYHYTLIVLASPKISGETTVFKETKELYDWAFKNLKLEIVASPFEKIIPNNIQVNLNKNLDGILLTPKEQITLLIPTSVDKSAIYWDVSNLPKTIDAPIKKGKEIGKVKLKLSDQEISEVDVICAKDVEADIFLYISNLIFKIATSWWFITSTILLIILILWIFLNKKFNIKKNKKKNFKRYKPFR